MDYRVREIGKYHVIDEKVTPSLYITWPDFYATFISAIERLEEKLMRDFVRSETNKAGLNRIGWLIRDGVTVEQAQEWVEIDRLTQKEADSIGRVYEYQLHVIRVIARIIEDRNKAEN